MKELGRVISHDFAKGFRATSAQRRQHARRALIRLSLLCLLLALAAWWVNS